MQCSMPVFHCLRSATDFPMNFEGISLLSLSEALLVLARKSLEFFCIFLCKHKKNKKYSFWSCWISFFVHNIFQFMVNLFFWNCASFFKSRLNKKRQKYTYINTFSTHLIIHNSIAVVDLVTFKMHDHCYKLTNINILSAEIYLFFIK